MKAYFLLFALFALSLFSTSCQVFAQEDEGNGREIFSKYLDNCYSNEDCQPCMDTLKILVFKRVNDIGIMLPSWKPVLGHNDVTTIEGKVIGASVSAEDLPLFHYTHDLGINVEPDREFEHLLTFYTNDEGKQELVEDYVHVEWESGLGASNKGNFCTEFNIKGSSAGFASAGHERYDDIWNWPSTGDWVHLEGLWIFDRGHPPAKTELHPLRFMGTRRCLPDKISEGEKEFYATRIDVYANGNGSAFYNNLPFAKGFVHKVAMGSKNYTFKTTSILPKPSANAKLKYKILRRKGNTFPTDLKVEINGAEATITTPWRSDMVADTAVLGQTVYLYWDEGNGVPSNFKIYTYNVTLDKLRIRTFSDSFNRSELRMFANVGGTYFFLNEILGGENDILNQKFGKSRKKKWNIGKSFTIYVPENWRYRVMAKGWEADGVNKLFGQIMDQNTPCTKETRRFLHDKMMDWTPVGFGGCMDDFTGMAENFHTGINLQAQTSFEILPSDGRNGDFCPGANYSLKDYFSLYYTVVRVGE